MGYQQEKGHNQLPGMGPLTEQLSTEFQEDLGHAAYDGVRVDKDSDDSRSTVTSKLQPGLVLVTSAALAGKWVDLDHGTAPNDGDITDCAILADWTNLLDKSDTRQDVQAKVLVHGQVQSAKLNFGTANAGRIAAAKAAAKLIRFV